MYRSDRALILSGGGARGAYEIGVWKRLCEMSWRPDLICGTSVGAINGAAIAAGLPLRISSRQARRSRLVRRCRDGRIILRWNGTPKRRS